MRPGNGASPVRASHEGSARARNKMGEVHVMCMSDAIYIYIYIKATSYCSFMLLMFQTIAVMSL